MATREQDRRVENLYKRLREAAEHVETLREEAAGLVADLRAQLNALMLERQALERLDDHRRVRIEHLSGARRKR
jgi:hypothetical protein